MGRVYEFRAARRRDAQFPLALTAAVAIGLGVGSMVQLPAATEVAPPAAIGGELSRSFGSCHTGGGTNCVVDGDTFWMGGEKIRIADIDAPETHPPHCAEEARLGTAATARLQALLNAGPIELTSADRDSDRYGRKLRIVMQHGRSVGAVLIDEGLARPWEGHRRSWCDASA
jgi:micrococcal nuclease